MAEHRARCGVSRPASLDRSRRPRRGTASRRGRDATVARGGGCSRAPSAGEDLSRYRGARLDPNRAVCSSGDQNRRLTPARKTFECASPLARIPEITGVRWGAPCRRYSARTVLRFQIAVSTPAPTVQVQPVVGRHASGDAGALGAGVGERGAAGRVAAPELWLRGASPALSKARLGRGAACLHVLRYSYAAHAHTHTHAIWVCDSGPICGASSVSRAGVPEPLAYRPDSIAGGRSHRPRLQLGSILSRRLYQARTKGATRRPIA